MSNENDFLIDLIDKKDNENNNEKEDDIKINIDNNKNENEGDNNKDDSFNFDDDEYEDEKINLDINVNKEGTPSNNILDRNNQDKQLLVSMGFDKILVDRIYRTVYPTNIDDALDYLQKDNNNKFTHSYIANNLNLCSICGCLRTEHAGETLLIERERQRQRERDRLLLNTYSSTSTDTYNSNSYKSKYSYKNDYGKKECGVCSDEIQYSDLSKVKLPCKHYFCLDCWSEYLKEKINNANVYKMSCMEHKCGYILEEKFVKSIIGSDKVLLEKYEKFLTRKKLMDSNKKIKFCPIPDCDGYAEKKKGKYVKCNFGHEFCFECLQQPHGKKKCAKVIDEGFEEWKSHTLVKRCPYCKFWTEKNEGCNHMTCSQCNFQWCWVCEKECVAGHYAFGPCKGLHFESVKSNEMARQLLKENCDLCCVITWFLTKFVYILIYLLMMPCFYLAVLGIKNLKDTNCIAIAFFCVSFIPFFICYEVWSICFITVISIPGLFICPYFRFLRYILFGKILGELFPV